MPNLQENSSHSTLVDGYMQACVLLEELELGRGSKALISPEEAQFFPLKDVYFSFLHLLEMPELVGIDSLHKLVNDLEISDYLDYDSLKQEMYSRATELARKQIEQGAPTVLFNIDRLSDTEAAVLVPEILEARTKEKQNSIVYIKSNRCVDLRSFIYTHQGLQIVKAHRLWRFCGTKDLEDMEKSLGEIGGPFRVIDGLDVQSSGVLTPALEEVVNSIVDENANSSAIRVGVEMLGQVRHPATVETIRSLLERVRQPEVGYRRLPWDETEWVKVTHVFEEQWIPKNFFEALNVFPNALAQFSTREASEQLLHLVLNSYSWKPEIEFYDMSYLRQTSVKALAEVAHPWMAPHLMRCLPDVGILVTEDGKGTDLGQYALLPLMQILARLNPPRFFDYLLEVTRQVSYAKEGLEQAWQLFGLVEKSLTNLDDAVRVIDFFAGLYYDVCNIELYPKPVLSVHLRSNSGRIASAYSMALRERIDHENEYRPHSAERKAILMALNELPVFDD